MERKPTNSRIIDYHVEKIHPEGPGIPADHHQVVIQAKNREGVTAGSAITLILTAKHGLKQENIISLTKLEDLKVEHTRLEGVRRREEAKRFTEELQRNIKGRKKS